MTGAGPSETNAKPGAIIPAAAAPLRSLTAVMAVMCYLAVLAVGSMILIDRAVSHWARGLSSEATVQLREISGRDMETDLALVVALLQTTPRLSRVEALPREAGAKLLEPWIGMQGLDKLPVPRLIRVGIDEKNPPDFVALEAALRDAMPSARLDTHRRWESELKRMAGTLAFFSGLVLLLISLSAIAMVVFAARAVLDSNRAIVDVLQLAGAEDRFIAKEIDRRFLQTGFRSGLIGLCLGMVTFLLLGFFGGAEGNGVAAAARGLFYIPKDGPDRQLLWFLLVPVVATLIGLLTSRFTLMRMLKELG